MLEKEVTWKGGGGRAETRDKRKKKTKRLVLERKKNRKKKEAREIKVREIFSWRQNKKNWGGL